MVEEAVGEEEGVQDVVGYPLSVSSQGVPEEGMLLQSSTGAVQSSTGAES
jgi:hypothetical protein